MNVTILRVSRLAVTGCHHLARTQQTQFSDKVTGTVTALFDCRLKTQLSTAWTGLLPRAGLGRAMSCPSTRRSVIYEEQMLRCWLRSRPQ